MMQLPTFITPWRLRWYAIAILVGLVLSLGIALCTGSGAKIVSGRLGGDYPAFYGAGQMVAQGQGAQLYEAVAQQQSQDALFPGENGFMPFPYPPYVALMYAPLSLLEYRPSFALHTVAMMLLLLATVRSLASVHPPLLAVQLPVYVLLLTFYPILRSVLGGQNTVISMLLLALVWRALARGQQVWAGVCIGLLLYKPQYAIPLVGLCLLARQWKTLAGFAGMALGCWLVGAGITGVDWVAQWLKYAAWVSEGAANIDPQNAVSFLGFLQALFGTENVAINLVGTAGILAAIFFVSWIWLGLKKQYDLAARMGLAAVALVWIQPHIMYYDLGLLVCTLVAMVMHGLVKKADLVAWMWLAGFSQPLGYLWGISPLFFLLLGVGSMASTGLCLNRGPAVLRTEVPQGK